MMNNLAIVILIVYSTLVCYPNEVLTQGFFGFADYHPEDNKSHGEDVQKARSNNSFLLYPPDCGLSNGEFNRVVGGQPAAIGAWPWMAALFVSSTGLPSDDVFLCGGTIISERHVLTAGHCFYGDESYAVGLGIHNIKEDEGVRIAVEEFIMHPKFIPIINLNDVAILRLKEKINFTDKIRPICLPLSPEIKNKNFTQTHPFVAGWGHTSYEGETSDVLLEAQVPVVSNHVCEDSYSKINEPGWFFFLDRRVICAGYSGVGACQGDSGGPLMFPLKNIYYLIGVVSASYRCAEPGFPTVYSRVTEFLDFIISNMN